MNKHTHVILLVALALVLTIGLFYPDAAYAGTGGDEFAEIYTKIHDWMQGVLGKLIAILFLLVGVAAGMVQRSVGAAVPALAAALILFFGPKVIEGIFTATLVVLT